MVENRAIFPNFSSFSVFNISKLNPFSNFNQRFHLFDFNPQNIAHYIPPILPATSSENSHISDQRQMARISSIIIFICIFPSMFALAKDTVSPVIQLPSEVVGEGKNVCAGAVASSAWCPVKCFRTDPVCGVDGVTYWCGCAEAACAGVEVGKMGFCKVGSGGSASLSAQAFLLLHIVWLIVLAFSVFFGLF